MIKVGVLGARGRMGSLVCQTVRGAGDLELVAEVDLGDELDPLAACEVVVDFTSPGAVMKNLRWCLEHGRSVVIGTSGFDAAKLDQAGELIASSPVSSAGPSGHPGQTRPRVLVVPNFSVGAVLMMKFAEQAARFFESVEIIELHHANKVDAPSGTAARTAAMIQAARSSDGIGPSPDATTTQAPGARGAVIEDVHVHSVRLAGLVAHQEVLLSGSGEMLTIRHDTLDRGSFMPGVLRAVRGVGSLPPGLTVGLDSLLGLST